MFLLNRRSMTYRTMKCGRKYCREDILSTGFSRFAVVLVKSHQRSHRDRGCFKTDKEHQEVSRGNHEIHSQQRRQSQEIEFTPFNAVGFFIQEFMCLQQYDECTDVQDSLHIGLHRNVLVHAACDGKCITWNAIQQSMSCKEYQCNGLEILRSLFTCKYIVNQKE